ncbi:hypothetical protein AGMMS49965_14380 [Bacteroidia bacterium]|nr:hypothetical protein AGMMS49965_14380 [Bacteroidia bacterium]
MLKKLCTEGYLESDNNGRWTKMESWENTSLTLTTIPNRDIKQLTNMPSNYKPIGDYIRLVDERNKDLKVETL